MTDTIEDVIDAGIVFKALPDGRTAVVIAHVLPAMQALALGNSLLWMGAQGSDRLKDQLSHVHQQLSFPNARDTP